MPISPEQLTKQIQRVESMPTVSAILQPLIGHLQQPIEQVETQRVVDLISSDNSLTAQCLHMANSPLFGRWQSITSVRSAVVALGMEKMRDIAVSCSMLRLFPGATGTKGPIVCWEHSLATALLSRRIARRIGYDLETAYLGGLLHDLGMVFHAAFFPAEFEAMLELCESGTSLEDSEQRIFGISHTHTGKMLAEAWNFSAAIVDTIRAHHTLSSLVLAPELVAIVHLSDRFCRFKGVGYGFAEQTWLDSDREPSLDQIKQYCPLLSSLNWTRLCDEMEVYLRDVKKLVTAIYHLS